MRSRIRYIKGFTLLEILAGISIIAILAAILFPSLKSIRERTRRSECAANLRQISLGLFAYANDHDNKLPPAITGGWAGGSQQGNMWGYQIWSYIHDGGAAFLYPDNSLTFGTPTYAVCLKNVFRCPATRIKAINAPNAIQPSPPRYSYGLNCSPAGSVWSAVGQPLSLLAVDKPSQTAMVMESSFPVLDSDAYFNYWGMIPHAKGCNTLFYDGHIEHVDFENIPTSSSNTFWSGR